MTNKKRDKKKGANICSRCGSRGAVFQRLGLNLCRRCFREVAPEMGFKKYR
ncbi:30S ribosomal protein S14 [candidate division MSBL1 archaeon SCGC-AAA261F19]|uniref:30S ribosomal protein S14 n=2 Tax=candidate division MSBL1 TaxID=215777 RepID=A0A133V9B3_9EURY|nr:30S ribosomal protein S14 [candidate division MSBL1 archaeon SCGC-AAA261F19]KXB04489.1 30S ribosomal protein S14 [candidate division MSBL1 archaeon SCGC-AAA261O19]